MIRTFRLSRLTGGMNTTAEENNLSVFNAPQGAQARDIENFMPLYQGGQSKAFGFTLHHALGSGQPLTGCYRFARSDGSVFFLLTGGTGLYSLAGGSEVTLSTGLANNAYTHFETALDHCIICDGQTAPKVFDGTTVSTLGGGAPTGARQSLFYQNRLWIFGGATDPSLLYFSAPNDIQTGYTTQFVQCDVNDGQKITAIARFFLPGTLEPIIVVGKENSVGIVTGDGTDTNPYTFSKVDFDFGIPGFRQVVQFGQNIAYLTPNGVASYNSQDDQVKLLHHYLSEAVRDRFRGMNAATLKDALCWLDWKHTRLSFAVPETDQPTPNVVYHYDYRLGCWYKERYAEGMDITCAYVDPQGTCYHGDSQGNLYRHDPGIHDYNGQAINAFYKTPFLDFDEPYRRKRILDARITVRSQGVYGLGIASMLDYGSRTGRTNIVSLSAGSYLWQGGVWTTEPTVYQWGNAPIKIKRFIPSGWFRNIQFTLSQSGANQPLDVFDLEFVVEFEELG